MSRAAHSDHWGVTDPPFPYGYPFFQWRSRGVDSPPPPLRRPHERRVAGAPAQRRVRSTSSLDNKLLGALVRVAAGAGFEASQDRGGSSAGRSSTGWLAAHLLRMENGVNRHGDRRTAEERRLCTAASVPPKPLAAVACVRLVGTQRAARVSICTCAHMEICMLRQKL